jgi:hypothetical protein
MLAAETSRGEADFSDCPVIPKVEDGPALSQAFSYSLSQGNDTRNLSLRGNHFHEKSPH